MDKDVTSLLPLGHLSDCEGLDSCLHLAFATLLVVTGTAGHGCGQTADVKAAQCGNTCAEHKEGAELEGSVMEELTVEGGARPGSRHENVNVIEKMQDGNDSKDTKGDEKEVQGEKTYPA